MGGEKARYFLTRAKPSGMGWSLPPSAVQLPMRCCAHACVRV